MELGLGKMRSDGAHRSEGCCSGNSCLLLAKDPTPMWMWGTQRGLQEARRKQRWVEGDHRGWTKSNTGGRVPAHRALCSLDLGGWHRGSSFKLWVHLLKHSCRTGGGGACGSEGAAGLNCTQLLASLAPHLCSPPTFPGLAPALLHDRCRHSSSFFNYPVIMIQSFKKITELKNTKLKSC